MTHARPHALLDALSGRVLRDEARAIFPGTVLPRDFDTIEIPFPERGEPELVRWEERQPPSRGRGGRAPWPTRAR